MIGHVEQPAAAAVAGEQQPGFGRERRIDRRQQLAQVFVGAGGVADVELHGLTAAHEVGDGQAARFAIGADDVADQKVAASGCAFILVDHAADVDAFRYQLAVGFAEFLEQLMQLNQRWLAGQLLDHLLLGLGDDVRPTDRPATLRDDGPDIDRTV